MRLIDGDAFVEDVDKIPEGGYLSPHDLISLINARPTIEERKKGKWIKKEKCYPDIEKQMDYRYECSECGFSDIHNATLEVPFCWHCGADMRGES